MTADEYRAPLYSVTHPIKSDLCAYDTPKKALEAGTALMSACVARHRTMTHIGPGKLTPNNFGYEFDLTLADCTVVLHGNGPRDTGAGKLEIIPPDGKRIGLDIMGAVVAAQDMLAAAKAVMSNRPAFADPEESAAMRYALDDLERAVAKAERRDA